MRTIPVTHRLLMIAAFLIIMAVVWWFFHQLFYEWLSHEAVAFVLVGMIGVLIGGWLGEKNARQHYVYGNNDWPFTRVKESYEAMAQVDPEYAEGLREVREQWRRRWPGVVALLSLPAAGIIIILITEWPR